MEDIAIVGMSCLFPGAGDTRAFWQNVVGAISDLRKEMAVLQHNSVKSMDPLERKEKTLEEIMN